MAEEQHSSGQVQGRTIAYFSEQEIIQYSRLELPIIQHLVEVGIISGTAVVGEAQRCYGAADLALLRRVRRLYQDLGVNLEGIEIIVRQNVRIETLQRELSRYQAQVERGASDQKGGGETPGRSGTEDHPF
jgi:DNA-binding transcriptional MerR regulator